MVEVALVNDNNDSIEIINTVSSLDQSIRLSKIIIDKNNIFELFANDSIDILIIDYNCFELIDNVNLLNLISKLKLILILTSKKKIENNSDKYIFCSKNNISQILQNFININQNISHNSENIIKNKIENELKYLGYNPSYYGTKYLLECIYYLYTRENPYYEKSLKQIYSIIGKKYNKSENTIKCDITRATSMMFYECEEEKLKKYLGICTLPKTGARIIIQAVINKLNFS